MKVATFLPLWTMAVSCHALLPVAISTLSNPVNAKAKAKAKARTTAFRHETFGSTTSKNSRLCLEVNDDPSLETAEQEQDVVLCVSQDELPMRVSQVDELPIPTPSVQESTPLLGIGGKDGVVYDVNPLKRNLVQETVQSYKKVLWELLGTPSASLDLVQDKLAALVQANPISTTTDSNLLDGGEWSFAIQSTHPASILFDSERFLKKSKGTALLGAAEKTFSTNARRYYLEDLREEERPYVQDQTVYLGGLLALTRTYHVLSLTRTKMDLDISRVQWNACGRPLAQKQYKPQSRNIQAIQILYIDSDLLISAEQGMDRPYTVYTKSPEWTARAQRVKRKLRVVGTVLTKVKRYAGGIISLRRKAIKLIQKQFLERVEDVKSTNLMLVEIKGEGNTLLKALKLGNSAADDAWEGAEDPFVHLTADERQEMLKTMNVRDIEKAGKEFQQKTAKEKKRVVLERKQTFQKPDNTLNIQ